MYYYTVLLPALLTSLAYVGLYVLRTHTSGSSHQTGYSPTSFSLIAHPWGKSNLRLESDRCKFSRECEHCSTACRVSQVLCGEIVRNAWKMHNLCMWSAVSKIKKHFRGLPWPPTWPISLIRIHCIDENGPPPPSASYFNIHCVHDLDYIEGAPFKSSFHFAAHLVSILLSIWK